MKGALFALVAGLAVSFAAPTAAAAAPGQAGEALVVAQAKKKKKRKLKKFDFTGDAIDATVVRPDGMGINVRGWATHESLVRIRQTFFKEIIRSTEDV